MATDVPELNRLLGQMSADLQWLKAKAETLEQKMDAGQATFQSQVGACEERFDSIETQVAVQAGRRTVLATASALLFSLVSIAIAFWRTMK